MIINDKVRAMPPHLFSLPTEEKRHNSPPTIYVYDIRGQLVAEYSTSTPQGDSQTSYLTADSLETPRVLTDSVGTIKARHDYLPFGEEISVGVGARTATQGYIVDGVRQKFTGKERDAETGLDYFEARYYNSGQGRFMSSDPVPLNVNRILDPQRFNSYAYARNNPIVYVDPDGQDPQHVIVKIVPKPYKVSGKTAKEAWDNAAKGPLAGGNRGLTTPEYRIADLNGTYSTPVQTPDGKFSITATVTDVKISLTVTVETPQWDAPAGTSTQELQTFQGYLDQLKSHEDGHIAIDTEGAENMRNDIIGTTVDGTGSTPADAKTAADQNLNKAINEKADTAGQRINERNRNYDQQNCRGGCAETKH
jgi:RHS repeat-associated protein